MCYFIRASKRDRSAIVSAISSGKILDGNVKVQSVGRGISALAGALDKAGFILDMVSGDLLLGDRGNRDLTFRRKNLPDADPFSEQPAFETRVHFVWENVGDRSHEQKRFEIIAYLT